jgi:hypothetical protein
MTAGSDVRGTAVLALVGLAAAALVIVFTFVPAEPAPGDAWDTSGSTYSPGPAGTRALFLLLQREGLKVEPWRRPAYAGLQPDQTLWLLTEGTLGAFEQRYLVSFVDRGGTLVVRPKVAAALLERAGLEAPEASRVCSTFLALDGTEIEPGDKTEVLRGGVLPAQTFAESRAGEALVAAWSVGRGRVVAFGAPDLTTNEHIGDRMNGIFLVHLARELGKSHAFDELKTGFGSGGVFSLVASVPYRGGLAQLGLTLVVALTGLGVRRQPVEPVRPEPRRSTRAHVDAVGHLWARSGDARLPLAALARAVDDRASAHVEASAEPFVDWVGRVKPRLAARAAAARRGVDDLCRASTPPSHARARAAGRELRAVEQEMRQW